MSPNQCLDIPIDHRLRNQLRPILPSSTDQSSECHVDILSEFGTSWQDYATGIPSIQEEEISFAKVLASPRTPGGILCILTQPGNDQVYYNDFELTAKQCETLRVTDELLKTTSQQTATLKNTSTFDIMPFVTKTKDRNSVHNQKAAQATFLAMVDKKKPQVVICCSG